MKIIDEFQTQAKIFYAGGNKIENGLSLFFVLDKIHYLFEDNIFEDTYGHFNTAYAISREFIANAKQNSEKWKDFLMCNDIQPKIISTFLNLMEELFVIFVKSENGSIFGKAEYKTEADYFVIHNGTYNHD